MVPQRLSNRDARQRANTLVGVLLGDFEQQLMGLFAHHGQRHHRVARTLGGPGIDHVLEFASFTHLYKLWLETPRRDATLTTE